MERIARTKSITGRVSCGPRSENGLRAWDTFETLLGTVKQQGVDFRYHLPDS